MDRALDLTDLLAAPSQYRVRVELHRASSRAKPYAGDATLQLDERGIHLIPHRGPVRPWRIPWNAVRELDASRLGSHHRLSGRLGSGAMTGRVDLTVTDGDLELLRNIVACLPADRMA